MEAPREVRVRERKQNGSLLRLGSRGKELVFNGYRGSVGRGEKVLEMDVGDGCTTV